MGKGSVPRPMAISRADYGRRYDAAFAVPCPQCGATHSVTVYRPGAPVTRQCVPCGHEWPYSVPVAR